MAGASVPDVAGAMVVSVVEVVSFVVSSTSPGFTTSTSSVVYNFALTKTGSKTLISLGFASKEY